MQAGEEDYAQPK